MDPWTPPSTFDFELAGHFQKPLDFWCEVCFLFFMTQHGLSDLGEPARVLAERHGTTEQTVWKWRKRDGVKDHSQQTAPSANHADPRSGSRCRKRRKSQNPGEIET